MENNQVTLSTGVVLGVAKPSRWLLKEKARQMTPRKPAPPKVYIEDKEIWEENPADPAFTAAVEEFLAEWNRAAENAQLICGTYIVSVPKGFARPEDDTWIDELREAYEIEVATKGGLRYANWVKLWACRTEEDNIALANGVAGLAGIPEQAVADAADSFRSREGGNTDMGVPAEAQGGDGNNVRPIRAKSGTRVRRA